jgi:phage terminase large subunit
MRHIKGPTRSMCARETQRSIGASVKQSIEDRIKEVDPKGEFFEILKTEINDANGGSIRFAGLRTNPDSVKSTEGLNIIWVDEAQRVSRRSLDILLPTIRGTDVESWFTWNPEHPTDPVDQLFRGAGGPPPDSLVWPCNYIHNPFFPDNLRELMEYDRRTDFDKWNWIWAGGYQVRSDAVVFKNWEVDEFTEDQLPRDAAIRLGADWGFAKDPTVVIRLYISRSKRRIWISNEACAIGCRIEDTPALFDIVPDTRNRRIVADSARPEMIDYMRRQGFNIESAVKGPNSLVEGIQWLQNYQITVHPRCMRTQDELKCFAHNVDPITEEILSTFEDKKNHLIDAMRYALESDRRYVMGDTPLIGGELF